MNHQDWNFITITKSKSTPKISTNQHLQNPTKIDKEDNIISVKKVSQQMAQSVIKARISKKMTQSDLAKATNIDSKTINDIEKGNCLYNANHFNKICNVFGVKIERNTN